MLVVARIMQGVWPDNSEPCKAFRQTTLNVEAVWADNYGPLRSKIRKETCHVVAFAWSQNIDCCWSSHVTDADRFGVQWVATFIDLNRLQSPVQATSWDWTSAGCASWRVREASLIDCVRVRKLRCCHCGHVHYYYYYCLHSFIFSVTTRHVTLTFDNLLKIILYY